MNSVADNKQELRARMRALRKAIPENERAVIDAVICENVLACEAYRQASVVLTYLSMGAEVDTRGIIEVAWQTGKTVAIPRCVGPRQMRWFRITAFDGLEKSDFGVEEPAVDEENEQLMTGNGMVALVPALAFDERGYRLGYGGGFYDTFLAEFEGTSIGLCRSAQFVESLEDMGVIGEYDLPVNQVVTEQLWFGDRSVGRPLSAFSRAATSAGEAGARIR